MACRHQNPLAAIDGKRNRIREHRAPGAVVPKLHSRPGIEREELTLVSSTEDHARRGGEESRPRRGVQGKLPDLLTVEWIQCANRAGRLVARDAAPRRKRHGWPTALVLIGVLLCLGVSAVVFLGPEALWNLAGMTGRAPAAAVPPRAVEEPLPVPRSSEAVLGRARTLALGGHLDEALRLLDRIARTDALRGEADDLKTQIQNQLLSLAQIDPRESPRSSLERPRP